MKARTRTRTELRTAQRTGTRNYGWTQIVTIKQEVKLVKTKKVQEDTRRKDENVGKTQKTLNLNRLELNWDPLG